MSLIRQVWLLLLATVLLAFVGGTWVSIDAARDTLQTQLRLKNADNATALALVLSQQKGDAQTMALVMSAQFDTGFFRRIVLRGAPGTAPLFEREADTPPLAAPAWFVHALPIESVPGIAQVSDGWRAIGTVEVASHTAYAHDDLWHGGLKAAAALAVVGMLAALVAALLLGRVRWPLEQTVAQARSLERGEYVTVAEPGTPELKRLTRAMNSMVARLKLVFEGQVAQLEALRRQVSHDALTGVANRGTFLGQFDAALHAEEGQGVSGLVLLRLPGLAALNRTAGHATTDRMIVSVAQLLQAYASEVPGCFIGRLNGSDFAIALPAPGVAGDTAQALVATLRTLLGAVSVQASAVAGALELRREGSVAEQLAAADQALARAESRGDFAVESVGQADDALARLGEGAWRRRLHDALQSDDGTRLRLAEYPVRARSGDLVHVECPLRVRLDAEAAHEPAVRWLPLALRSRLTAELDARAISLALQAIAGDGRPRGVNVAPASLGQGGLAARVRDLLEASPRAARSLWIEVAEVAAAEQFEHLQEFGRLLRPLGVRFGLEHAGERLTRIDRLFELGLDYVKLDSALGRGIGRAGADREARASLVRGITTMLHSLSLQVIAEGVADASDAQALWDCGVDAMTGPWVSATEG
jgi:EAL domain-containing protein (putative c-di-GMP-specific phosphodiesterase class I)/GGDEF domain-containing protein